MREIQLTQGKVAWVDEEDYERVNAFKWFALKLGNTFYAVRNITVNGRRTIQYMHRFIIGDTLGKSDIDHADRDGCNNRNLNLRPCTHQENLMNQSKRENCSSKYIGVYWNKHAGKWMAGIRIDGKTIYLGLFDIEEDAARAYDVEAFKRDPIHCRLNFPI